VIERCWANAGTMRRQVFSGSAHPDFAARIAKSLGTEVASSSVGRFNDGEVSIKINASVRCAFRPSIHSGRLTRSASGADVYVVQPTGPPVSDTLIELLLMVSALRNASAKRVTAVVPYFGASAARGERLTSARAGYMRFDGGQMPSRLRRTTAKSSAPEDDDIGDELETHRCAFSTPTGERALTRDIQVEFPGHGRRGENVRSGSERCPSAA